MISVSWFSSHAGSRIFIGTGCGEPQCLVKALINYVRSHPKAFFDAELLQVWTLGVAPYADEKFKDNFRHNSYFIGRSTRDAVAKEVRKVKYSGITGEIEFDGKGDRKKAGYFILQVGSDDPAKWDAFRRRYFAELDANADAWLPLLEAGKPAILVDDLYGGSGQFLIDYAIARRAGRKVAGVSSSRIEDVAEAEVVDDGTAGLEKTSAAVGSVSTTRTASRRPSQASTSRT